VLPVSSPHFDIIRGQSLNRHMATLNLFVLQYVTKRQNKSVNDIMYASVQKSIINKTNLHCKCENN